MPKNKTPILIVDDDVGLLTSIRATLLSSGMPEPALVSDSRKAIELVRDNGFHLVLIDLLMPHLGGMKLLQKLKHEFPSVECVIITAVDDVSRAVQAMRFGAYDYLVKPLQRERLIIVINNALERYNLRYGIALRDTRPTFAELENPEAFKDMVAHDRAMARVFCQAEACASTDYNTLITGETGVGKEMLARIIHDLSNRAGGPFVAVNMGGFTGPLFEDAFFGHAKGAYTGAVSERQGFFETARSGTIFLDEIAELPPDLQGKLLRVIEERELYRLGSTEIKEVDVRIIAATNRNIREELTEGRFRQDLFYRLNMCPINIPPLRERKKDILPLARHFIKRHAEKNKKNIKGLAPDSAQRLLYYPFPGNVRELENIIASAVLIERGNLLALPSSSGALENIDFDQERPLGKLTLASVQRQHILHVLETTNGNRTHAARILGIGIRTLQRKLKAFEKTETTPK